MSYVTGYGPLHPVHDPVSLSQFGQFAPLAGAAMLVPFLFNDVQCACARALFNEYAVLQNATSREKGVHAPSLPPARTPGAWDTRATRPPPHLYSEYTLLSGPKPR